MRSHLLNDHRLLSADALLRRADFDFYCLREVTALKWEVSPGVGTGVDPELVLTFRVEGVGHGVGAVQMRCIGVRRLMFPEMAPNFWTSEIEIEDLTGSQLEGIRYCVKSYGGDFGVWCRNVALACVSFP
jgi:hypothetical protein